MSSLMLKADAALRRRLEEADDDTTLTVEIRPQRSRWRGLLRQLRSAASRGVEYNVVEITWISARMPKWMLVLIAERRDVEQLRLWEDA